MLNLFDKLGFLRLTVDVSLSVILLLLLELLSADKKLFALPDTLNPSSNHIYVTCKNSFALFIMDDPSPIKGHLSFPFALLSSFPLLL